MSTLNQIRKFFLVYLAGVASALAGFLIVGSRKRKGPAICEANQSEAEMKFMKEQDEAQKARIKKADDAETIRKRIISGTLLFILAAVAWAAPVYADSSPFVPEDYAALKQYYLAAWDLSEKYRALYTEAEAAVSTLREENARLQQQVQEMREQLARQEAELADLHRRKPSFVVTGGVTWSSSGPGTFLGGGFTW